jgi:serine/threonine protein kinase
MEYCSEETVTIYVVEVLIALEYLQMQGFIYQNVKPENILIHESGHIKLTDLCKASVIICNHKIIENMINTSAYEVNQSLPLIYL